MLLAKTRTYGASSPVPAFGTPPIFMPDTHTSSGQRICSTCRCQGAVWHCCSEALGTDQTDLLLLITKKLLDEDVLVDLAVLKLDNHRASLTGRSLSLPSSLSTSFTGPWEGPGTTQERFGEQGSASLGHKHAQPGQGLLSAKSDPSLERPSPPSLHGILGGADIPIPLVSVSL